MIQSMAADARSCKNRHIGVPIDTDSVDQIFG
jgi:hypothetical protein